MTKKDLILGAAAQEFAEHGFAGARVARIAGESGANKQLIYYYFGSKEGLYEALIESSLGQLEFPPVDSAPGERAGERLRAVVDGLAAFFDEHPEVAGLWASAAGPGARARRRALLDRVAARLERVIADGQRFGYFRDDVDTDLVARHAAVLTLGYVQLSPARSERERPPPWVAGVSDLLSRYLTW